MPKTAQSRLPIFIICHDRLNVLLQCIASYQRQIKTAFEIIIHDNLSTYPPFVKWLKKCPYRVYWNKRNNLNDVGNSIRHYFATTRNTCKYYAVTDPDIEFTEQCPGDVLAFYVHLLKSFPRIQAAGPDLKRDDIPDYYPLKHDVLRRYKALRSRDPIRMIRWKSTIVKCCLRPVDTTFAVYRRTFTFKRLSRAILAWGVYQARHLDWYINPEKMEPDQIYYLNQHKSRNRWGHWSSIWLKQRLVKNKIIPKLRQTTTTTTIIPAPETPPAPTLHLLLPPPPSPKRDTNILMLQRKRLGVATSWHSFKISGNRTITQAMQAPEINYNDNNVSETGHEILSENIQTPEIPPPVEEAPNKQINSTLRRLLEIVKKTEGMFATKYQPFQVEVI